MYLTIKRVRYLARGLRIMQNSIYDDLHEMTIEAARALAKLPGEWVDTLSMSKLR